MNLSIYISRQFAEKDDGAGGIFSNCENTIRQRSLDEYGPYAGQYYSPYVGMLNDLIRGKFDFRNTLKTY